MELQVKEQPGGHRTILGGLSPALSTVLRETSKELSYPFLAVTCNARDRGICASK